MHRSRSIGFAGVALTAVVALVLTGCSTSSPTGQSVDTPDSKITGSLTIMRNPQDITDQTVKDFNKEFPKVKITLVDQDDTKLKALQAAGNPPDIWRTQGPLVAKLVNENQLLDLSPYFAKSKLLPESDLSPANDSYKVDGKRYGVVKDWSPDYTFYVNNKLFDQAGVAIPDPTKPMSWANLADLAAKVTSKTGSRTNAIGIVGNPLDFPLPRSISVILAEQGQDLYAKDQKSIKLTENPKAMEALKYFVDIAKAGNTWTPANPDPSWGGDDFTKGQAAIAQYGMWFAGFMSTLSGTQVGDDFTFYPAPYWSTPSDRIDPTVTAVGYVASSKTKSPLAAWKFIEWYGGGAPATARAKQGWGVPAKVSDYALLPNDTDAQKKINAVLKTDLKLVKPLQFDKYYDDTVFVTSYNQQLESYLKGDITFDQLAANVEKDVNAAIADGVQQAG